MEEVSGTGRTSYLSASVPSNRARCNRGTVARPIPWISPAIVGFVRIGYLSDHLLSLVIDYSAIEYSAGFEQRMGATVRVAPYRAVPGASLPSIIVTVTLRVTIDYFGLFAPKVEIGPLCYNGFQRYCHGLLVTR